MRRWRGLRDLVRRVAAPVRQPSVRDGRPTKVICGLGNPGPEYDDTRHNVGWWVLDRLAADWRLGPFEREGDALVAAGSFAGHRLLLLKPLTYMNRSGAALARFFDAERLDPARDLLVVVDDVALDPGALRFRGGGSAGGHNGLKSVETALGTTEYARLRIGVGAAPAGVGLADWVLSPFEPEDEETIVALLPDAVAGVRAWIEDGIDAAMSRFNRKPKGEEKEKE